MFRGRRSRGIQSNRNNLGLLLLVMQLVQFGVDRIPTVTLATILINVGLFVRLPEMLEIEMPAVRDICVSYKGVAVYKEYIRLFLSGFYHLSDMHLYYNMVSLLYKGHQLEPRLGSAKFGVIMGVILGLSNIIYCCLQYLLFLTLDDASYLKTCAAGFSAVLFGLKVVLQDRSPPSHRLFGIPIHLAYWSELIWISIIAPQVSFVGHLSGILAGMLLTQGPLKFIITGQVPIFFRPAPEGGHGRGTGVTTGGRPGTWGSGTTGGGDNDRNSEDADLQEAIRRSLNDPFQPDYDTGPSGYDQPYHGTHYSNKNSSGYHGNAPYTTNNYHGNSNRHNSNNSGYHDNSSRLYPTIPSAPPMDDQPPSLPLSHEEIRQRRIQRFD